MRKEIESEEAASLGEDNLIESQRLADCPGLEEAAARRMRRLAVGDFADVTETGVVEVLQQGRKKPRAGFPLRFAGAAADAHPRLDEWPPTFGT